MSERVCFTVKNRDFSVEMQAAIRSICTLFIDVQRYFRCCDPEVDDNERSGLRIEPGGDDSFSELV